MEKFLLNIFLLKNFRNNKLKKYISIENQEILKKLKKI